LSTVGAVSYSYDPNGNLTSETGGSGRTFTYDDENRLISVQWGGSAYKTEFAYDGLSRLRKRTEKWYNGSTWTTTGETRYLCDGMLVVQERNSGNTPTVTYTRGKDLSGSVQGAGGIGGLLGRSHGYSSGSWSTHNFYHADGSGNITCMVNTTNGVVASYKYDAYGRTLSSSGPLSGANVYRFSSKEWIYGASVYHFGYRFYDPTLQRWLNRDPIGELGGINLYGFLFNDALSSVDPFGLDRTVYFFLHMWIEVDQYDASGNVTGRVALNFSPVLGEPDYQVYPAKSIPYAHIPVCKIKSTRQADNALVSTWQAMGNPSSDQGASWTPWYNCIVCSLSWAFFGTSETVAPPYSGGSRNLPPVRILIPTR